MSDAFAVLQEWVCTLPLMQQTVLIVALRGPDNVDKNHIGKFLLRWMRRCVLYSAMDRRVLKTPCESGGGSFTGPSYPNGATLMGRKGAPSWYEPMDRLVTEYLAAVDLLPHHFQLHFMHAAGIIGYKHPDTETRAWWHYTYLRLVNDMHLRPEPQEAMDRRLGDDETSWRAAEEVTASTYYRGAADGGETR